MFRFDMIGEEDDGIRWVGANRYRGWGFVSVSPVRSQDQAGVETMLFFVFRDVTG
jgi:hypothetical protein